MLINSDIYELNVIWSRLIHRFHTLGTTQQTYINSIGGITEKRIYPHHIPSSKENKSISIDGDQVWQTRNWKKGWVKIQESTEAGSFLFASNTGSIFHKVELLPESEWECFQCILKISHRKKVDKLKGLTTKTKHHKIRPSATQYTPTVLNTLDESASNNKAIHFMMPTSGGLINRVININDLSLNDNIISAKSQESGLAIDMSKVSHVDVNRRSGKILTTLSNKNGTPQFIIETT